MADPGPFVADLRAESDDLDALVAHLPADRWADPTPAPGWTIAHQIGHLLWTDRVALTAVTDEAGFAELMTAAAANPAGSSTTPRQNWRPFHLPNCSQTGGSLGGGCTRNCWRFPMAANWPGSGHR